MNYRKFYTSAIAIPVEMDVGKVVLLLYLKHIGIGEQHKIAFAAFEYFSGFGAGLPGIKAVVMTISTS